MGAQAPAIRGFDLGRLATVFLLLVALVAEGAAVSHSLMWAAPLVALLLVAAAVDLPIVPFVGGILLVRILTDASLFSSDVRETGAFNFSAGIAILFTLVAIGLSLRRQKGLGTSALLAIALGVWTGVAVMADGLSTVTVREGIREASMIAVAVIVCNAGGKLKMPTVVRILQIAGVISAVVAINQFAHGTGVLINGEIRSAGTFTHPNGACMYFAIATTASIWRYFDHGRRKLDLAFTAVFAAAAVSTFSLSGLGALLAMLLAYGTLRKGSRRLTIGTYTAAVLVIVAFLATPLGSERLSSESETNLNATHSHETENTSLGWRFYKWGFLIEEWAEDPILGHGLGTTLNKEGAAENVTAGSVPHNEYLRYLVETGIVGFSLVILGIGALLRALKRRRLIDPSGAAILGTAIVVGCLVNGMADNTFLYTTTGYAVALIIGSVLTLPAAVRSPSKSVVAAPEAVAA